MDCIDMLLWHYFYYQYHPEIMTRWEVLYNNLIFMILYVYWPALTLKHASVGFLIFKI